MPHKILFVCTGNICRSPTAEGVARGLAQRFGMAQQFEFDSAGTHGYHIGEAPDPRSVAAAKRRGFELAALRARRVTEFDFVRFDHVLAMDREHLELLQQACPREHRAKLRLFLEYGEGLAEDQVPDPYYGGPQGFEHVLDLVEAAATHLIRSLAAK
ncbi:MAG: low molecular weight phosphotyrosine protein phosphatase [Burkholderiaceae bacterium]|nr:low molecular weight phosphotyrosine protein phosphatase [Sulfuritalea sp.]MCF8175376.1 low molecular weight phosphotyrosine protein phosphatase [Burkholderiaceae bacterium]MCF8184563.1 low molecular weight phosphotyrosine protein phosphatase [Polynucleobacter sp.]